MKFNDNFSLQRVLMLDTPNLLNVNCNSKDKEEISMLRTVVNITHQTIY